MMCQMIFSEIECLSNPICCVLFHCCGPQFWTKDNFSLFENRKTPRDRISMWIVTMLSRFWVSTFFSLALKVIYLLCGAQFFAVRQKSILDCDLSIFHKEMLNRFYAPSPWLCGLLSNLILR